MFTIVFTSGLVNTTQADQVKILLADFRNTGANHWTVSVSLKHADSGWDHYADRWRLVDAEGRILGERVLLHPHIDEQPFSRSLSDVLIPINIKLIYIEAHDKVHGWSPQKLQADMGKARNGQLKLSAD